MRLIATAPDGSPTRGAAACGAANAGARHRRRLGRVRACHAHVPLEGFASTADLRNQLAGAILMGAGGVTALGCTIGQGLSGLSTMSIGSMIAVAGIVAGTMPSGALNA